ncbi:MAG: hypothetical protein DHS20C13_19760 [Thermodesulfobacteriota bacterium]|nr:MAG: hypothetical protein DHS20C13_19760 [Thermodesulfobacteriota bacterium]
MGIHRRQFLSLAVKTIGAAGLIKAYGFKGVFAFADETKKAAPSPAPKVWSSNKMVINTNSGVVHWPHPEVFKITTYSVAPHNAKQLEVDDSHEKVAKNPKLHFDKSKSGVIYEHLALSEIEIEDEKTLSFDNGSINESIEILKIAVNEPGNSNNWRIYDLIARLVSLKNEQDPDKARAEIVEIFSNSKVSGDWNKRDNLSKISDKDEFEKWHTKTVDKTHGDYRKKLINRVNSSKKLTNDTLKN